MASPSIPPLTRFQKWVMTLATEDYYGAWELRPNPSRDLLSADDDAELTRKVRDEVTSLRELGLVEFWIGHEDGDVTRAEDYAGLFDPSADASWAIPKNADDVQLFVTSTAEGDRIYREHWDPSWG